MSNLQVITALDQSINDSHARSLGVAERMKGDLIEFANEILQCGLLLIQRKKQVKHGEWLGMFRTALGKHGESAIFAFDHSWGCKYMQLARVHPDVFTNVEDAREHLRLIHVIAGVLEDKQGHGEQRSHEFSFATEFSGLVSRLDQFWNKHRGDAFVASLKPHERDQVADNLRPIKERIDAIWKAVAA